MLIGSIPLHRAGTEIAPDQVLWKLIVFKRLMRKEVVKTTTMKMKRGLSPGHQINIQSITSKRQNVYKDRVASTERWRAQKEKNMILTSPAFKNEQAIPIGYAGEGGDISPPLEWSHIPQNTREFVLIFEDLDARSPDHPGEPFVHWLAYNISRNVSLMPAGILPNELRLTIPVSLEQGTNSFGKIGYRGRSVFVAAGCDRGTYGPGCVA